MVNAPSPDALPPRDMAHLAEEIGVKKAGLDAITTLVLALLAGAFIALGAALSTTVAAGIAPWPYGVGRLLVGFSFSLGLILVVVGGAELFTGNNLIVMAWASRKVSTARVLRNWGLVYLGNFAGAVLTAALIYASGQWRSGQGQVTTAALAIADGKLQFTWVQAFVLGSLCNALVCLAVWLAMSARSTTDRIFAVVPPVVAFVACGFEHSVANMYFLPLAAMIRGDGAMWGQMWTSNLVPVTLGNLVGGAGLVGGVYWLAYLRGERSRTP
jgi:formate/nitrite transporter